MPLSPRTLRPANTFTPRSISGLALWLDASASGDLFTTDAGPVVPVSDPRDIAGCALWLDASDSSTITHTGGAVSEWRDKTTNGRHYTASTTARPSTGTRTQNGLNVIDFDGTKQMAGNAASLSLFRNASAGHVFIVQKMDVTSANQYVFTSSSGTNANVQRAQVFADGGGNFCVGGTRVDGDGLAFISQGAISTNLTLVSAHFDWANSDLFLRRDGVLSTSTTTFLTDGSTSNTDSLASVIGGAGAGYRLDGFIAELIVFNTAITPAQRASVEAYLAQRWGISGVHAPATAASDPVGYWRDRSGNGRHATQATAANRPTIHTATQNGRRVLSFDGSNDALLGAGAQALKDGMTVIGAYAAGSVNFASLFGVGDNVAGRRWLSGSSNGRIGADFYTSSVAVTAVSSNRTGINSFTFSPSANAIGIRVDGAQALLQSSLSPALSAFTSNTLAVGTVPAANEQWWAGRIFELAVYNRVLSASECRRVEQALAAKWGITLAPQVSNADAQDWVNRVYANGGTVTASTAAAVNQFCIDIENAPGGSLRDRFYRLNLFAGTGLNACLVPLYRGQSLGGAQFGGTADTNQGPFFSGDYVETGSVSGGLTSSGSQYLNTGFATNLLAEGNRHLAAYEITRSAANFKYYLGAEYAAGGGAGQFVLGYHGNATSRAFGFGAFGVSLQSPTTTAGGFWMGVNQPSGTGILYRNGSQDVTGTASAATPEATNIYVFTANRSNGSAAGFAGRLGGYSIGLSMTGTQAAAYSTAMQAFQTALQRNT